MRGEEFRGAFTAFPKKNFRLYFRGDYGATKLEFPLFEGFERGGIEAVQEFDQLEVRSGSHDMKQRGFYLSNRFTDDVMLDTGDVNPHGRYVHLYLNGTYWGLYHLRERWHAARWPAISEATATTTRPSTGTTMWAAGPCPGIPTTAMARPGSG